MTHKLKLKKWKSIIGPPSSDSPPINETRPFLITNMYDFWLFEKSLCTNFLKHSTAIQISVYIWVNELPYSLDYVYVCFVCAFAFLEQKSFQVLCVWGTLSKTYRSWAHKCSGCHVVLFVRDPTSLFHTFTLINVAGVEISNYLVKLSDFISYWPEKHLSCQDLKYWVESPMVTLDKFTSWKHLSISPGVKQTQSSKKKKKKELLTRSKRFIEALWCVSRLQICLVAFSDICECMRVGLLSMFNSSWCRGRFLLMCLFADARVPSQKHTWCGVSVFYRILFLHQFKLFKQTNFNV